MPQRVPPATIRKAFRAYLETGSLAAAAHAVEVHPKTIQRHARREKWKQRRERIEAAAADRADLAEIDRLTEKRLAARYKWTHALSEPATREGLLAILRELLRRPT